MRVGRGRRGGLAVGMALAVVAGAGACSSGAEVVDGTPSTTSTTAPAPTGPARDFSRADVAVIAHRGATARGPSGSCTGSVADKTLTDLYPCDMGSWFNEAHPDLAQPAFADQRLLG